MTGLDYAAFFVLALIALIMVGVLFFIGNLPGSVARKRHHPNVEAIVMGNRTTKNAVSKPPKTHKRAIRVP